MFVKTVPFPRKREEEIKEILERLEKLMVAEGAAVEEVQRLERKEFAYRRDGRLNWHERDDLRDDYNGYQKKLQHELRDGERRY